MRKSSVFAIAVIIVLIGKFYNVFAQNEKYVSREKIYIQLDKPFYNQNDIIRFNLVVLDAQSHYPTTMSDVVYTELISPKGTVIKKITLPIFDGTAKGDFDIPNMGGIYLLKAYTTWSKNFNDIKILERKIPVQNVITPRLLLKPDFDRENYGPNDEVLLDVNVRTLKNEPASGAEISYTLQIAGIRNHIKKLVADDFGNITLKFNLPHDLNTTDVVINVLVSYDGINESVIRAIPIVLNKINLKFYPEGGHPVSGYQTKIAFEALDEYSNGADVEGIILDQEGNYVTSFKSFHNGIGVFDLTYSKKMKYTAMLTSPSSDKVYYLPESQDIISLTLAKRTPELLSFKLNGEKDEYILSAYCRGKKYLSKHIEIDSDIVISIDSLPIGIVRFEVGDVHGTTLSERLVFVKSNQTMSVKITPKNESYLPGEEVILNIETKDSKGNPAPMKLGLSVVDDQLISFADDKNDNILSYFYLTSELKGYISDPGFYFDTKEETANEALDQLMMVRGWANYSWNSLDSTIILYPPEKIRIISGRLVNKHGDSAEGYVYAMERSENKRMLKVKTTEDGHFVIRNFNPVSDLLLFTKKPNKLIVDDKRVKEVKSSNIRYPWWYNDTYYEEEIFFDSYEIDDTGIDPTLEPDSFESSFDMSMDSDVNQLSEVVVTGYGEQELNSLTSCVTVIQGKKLDDYGTMMFLQGTVAGITIANLYSDIVIPSNISFSRTKSLVSGNSTPLVVLNGVSLTPSISKHFINSTLFSPEQVSSITYMDSPEASLQFGSKAGNGVIFLQTKSMISPYSYSYSTTNGKYNGMIITSRKFNLVRDSYEVPEHKIDDKNGRKFVEYLVYWNPEIIINKDGKAKVSFHTNDNISNYKIIAEGIAINGNLGRGESSYYTEKPISIDIKLPSQIGLEDKVNANAIISNETEKSISGELIIDANGLNVSYEKNIKLDPHVKKVVPVQINTTGKPGKFKIKLSLTAAGSSDNLEKSLLVYPIGFSTSISHSGSNPNGSFSFQITNAEKGTISTDIVIYPNVISDLESSAEALFREPHGCFEQVSSTTYPSILALRYLNTTGKGSALTKEIALRYIKMGYNKLMAYEINGGGFEWFGHKPAHEALTAFGLIEFTQMKKVYSGVDDAMIERTILWLLNRRDGLGGFIQTNGKYGFSAASREVNNAYIVYALSEAGIKNLSLEYNNALEEAKQSKDYYRLALLANAAYNIGDTRAYDYLVTDFKNYIQLNGLNSIKASHSIVRSYGDNLNKEVISLWILALLKESNTDIMFISKLVNYLLEHRQGGYYGSTQATSLSLQAITEYNLKLSNNIDPGTIEVWLNGYKRSELLYNRGVKDPLKAYDLGKFLNDSVTNNIELRYPNKKAQLPYSIVVNWMDKTPRSNIKSLVDLQTKLNSSNVALNNTVRMLISISNRSSNGQPMTIARIGIPGGLSLQTWQLKEIQEKKTIDYYEIINDDLIIYFKEMGPNQIINIPLDLKAEIPGVYEARASSSYLYYNDSNKFWVPGVKITIIDK